MARAEAQCSKDGRSLCLRYVSVEEHRGEPVAHFHGLRCYQSNHALESVLVELGKFALVL